MNVHYLQFHQHKITKENYMCSDFNYVIKPQDEHLTQLNSITDNGINIPSTIKKMKLVVIMIFYNIQKHKVFKVFLQK